MSNVDLKNISESLIQPFFEAGKEAKQIVKRGVKITIKSDNSPVTDGDIAVNKILCKNIKNLTPDIPIISEETVNLEIKNKNKTFWLVDPIDGTKEYINKKDEYTLNAALIIDAQPALGFIYAPKKNRMFFSYGKGYSFELSNGVRKKLNCEKKTEKGKIYAVTYSSNPSKDILDILKKNNVLSFTKMSSSYKFCVIAAGEADIYTCEARAYEWDIAAGHAIIKHSGGIITTSSGKEILYGKEKYKNPSLLVKRSINLEIWRKKKIHLNLIIKRKPHF